MALSDAAFDTVCELFLGASGIRLGERKRSLVEGRLQKLAARRGMADLTQYVADVVRLADGDELARMVDALTTNETYFFREPQHFEHLSRAVDQWAARDGRSAPLRVWSAAASSGEEAYSIAMVLAGKLGLAGWEVVGTDLSSAMVEAAETGLYPLERARQMPPALLRRWCLRGEGAYDGQLLVNRELRERVCFLQANLNEPLPDVGSFEVIFLRNVLIYFDEPGKAAVVRRVLAQLRPGGLLMAGHAESLLNLDLPLRPVATAVYTHGKA